MQDSIIKAAIEIKHFFIFSDPALTFIPLHNADYTCTNCANPRGTGSEPELTNQPRAALPIRPVFDYSN